MFLEAPVSLGKAGSATTGLYWNPNHGNVEETSDVQEWQTSIAVLREVIPPPYVFPVPCR